MNDSEIHGRFLPSRVYLRWKSAVRLGILIVPFLVLLSGGLTLFLTASKYDSTTVFSLENGPPPAEIVNLIHASRTFQGVIKNLELQNRWGVDRDTAGNLLDGICETRILPDSRWIELTVTHTNKVDARDIAEEIPKALIAHIREHQEAGIAQDLIELGKLIQDATDSAEDKASHVAKIRQVHGSDTAGDAEPAGPLQRALRASLLADAEVERLQSLRHDLQTAKIDQRPRLLVHTGPAIANSPASPNVGDELAKLTLHALVSGLLVALLLPYLLEFVFPPSPGKSKQAHSLSDPITNL
jgi:hypothetical protein